MRFPEGRGHRAFDGADNPGEVDFRGGLDQQMDMVGHDAKTEDEEARIEAGVEDNGQQAGGERRVAEVRFAMVSVEGREVGAGFAVIEAAEAERRFWYLVLPSHIISIRKIRPGVNPGPTNR